MRGVHEARDTAEPGVDGRDATGTVVTDVDITRLVERGLDVVPGVVASLASRFPRHVDRAELVRAGTVGVVEAAWRFDPSRGVPFERYAARRVRGAVLDAVRAEDWVPRSVRAEARRIELVEYALTARLGRRPTAGEIGRELELSADRVDRVRAAAVAGLIDRLDVDGDGIAPADDRDPGPTAALERAELLGYLRDALDGLTERHRRVVLGVFVEGRTTIELAVELGVSRSRVSQLRAEAVADLRRRILARYEPSPAD
ncbi:MAG: sigma-70 family RNA polymerase sigma factor [Acidimicrobiia bacterium]|nr:sigma-70 family RNA polymerase sigma factor [Acidimicrobiia bacterium]